MAMNPMQKRARNAFIIGFFFALIIMFIVVAMQIKKQKGLQQQIDSLKSLQKSYLVASTDLRSGQVVKFEDFSSATVQTTVDPSEVVDDTDFFETDKDGAVLVDENGQQIPKEVMMKIDVPSGTIVTKKMIEATGDKITDTDRIQEYNMIALPSQLKNGDYIDIRIALTNGQDYLVLTKKRVLGCTETGIWMKMNEFEMELLNGAIVDSYMISGAKLYAIEYVEPGTQSAAQITYAVGDATLRLMKDNPNIVDDVKKAYDNYANFYTTAVAENRLNYIESAISGDTSGNVSSGYASEIQAMQKQRQEYVKALEGTEDIGYTQDE